MNSNEERDWYFTFGVSDKENSKKYVNLYGTCEDTRYRMMHTFGSGWAMHYRELS